MWGVLLWPLFYAGHLEFYPSEAHTRIMIQGFLGAFVLGFLGTAFPRLAGNRRWSALEFGGMLLLWGLSMIWHSTGKGQWADFAFASMLVLLWSGMAGRWMIGRGDTPPPGFVLAFAGIAGAAVAAVYLGWADGMTPFGWRLARLFLFQGFLLLPLMGIGPYLLPRFFGRESKHSFETSRCPPAGWWRRAAASVVAGVLVAGSFVIEAMESPLAGQLLRAAVVVIWFAWETPVFRTAKQGNTPASAVRWAVSSLIVGLVCAASWPHARVGSLHLFFVSGLGLVTLTAGTRVILGHAGRHDLLTGKIIWLRWVTGLVVLAAATRMTSDFIPAVRVSHHIYAAWTWVAAGAIWLLALGRFLLRDDSGPPKTSRCPRNPKRTEPHNPAGPSGASEPGVGLG
jgi:uncharacterized protein involved in response to NO